jgi:hypothetical protein
MNPQPNKPRKDTPYNREGDIVGATAPEISSSSKGRQMLEKMGWKSGSGLGKEGSDMGILSPIEAVVKTSRAGLGMSEIAKGSGVDEEGGDMGMISSAGLGITERPKGSMSSSEDQCWDFLTEWNGKQRAW